MEIEKYSVETLKKGYTYEKETEEYICLECGEKFRGGEVYSYNQRFFEAFRAIELHIEREHGDRFLTLLYSDNKYLSVTKNQKELLSLIHQGYNDKEVAEKVGVSASTVRHQRFMFREKAKQAKMYLALYELSSPVKQKEQEKILPIHGGATMVDDRFVITQQENEKILTNAFISLEPLKLKLFPVKEKKKIAILNKIIEKFEQNRRYTEKEVNGILSDIFDDYVTLRRYLIEYGYMDRTIDCKEYWLK